MFQDLEEQRELATNRYIELEEMSGKYKSSLKEVERLKMELSTLPGVVTSTFASPFDSSYDSEQTLISWFSCNYESHREEPLQCEI